MRISGLVKTLELVVPLVGGEELTFRLEILRESARRKRAYRLRLYRLEFMRLRVRGSSGKRGTWRHADYRCWVVDDNLLDDSTVYASPVEAESKFRRILERQLKR